MNPQDLWEALERAGGLAHAGVQDDTPPDLLQQIRLRVLSACSACGWAVSSMPNVTFDIARDVDRLGDYDYDADFFEQYWIAF